jgi:hypothetical protein
MRDENRRRMLAESSGHKIFVTVTYVPAGPSGRSPAEIVGSNPTGGIDVFLL